MLCRPLYSRQQVCLLRCTSDEYIFSARPISGVPILRRYLSHRQFSVFAVDAANVGFEPEAQKGKDFLIELSRLFELVVVLVHSMASSRAEMAVQRAAAAALAVVMLAVVVVKESSAACELAPAPPHHSVRE